jgi:tyrocidine synthetase-3
MKNESQEHTRTGLEIAVIGMAGRFPGAAGIDEFWENLKNGAESISFFSGPELEEAGLDPQLTTHPNYVKAKGVLEGIEFFDFEFFDYTRSEAGWMDPQLRLLHECCWHALEDAGYDPDSYPGAIGLFAGTLANYQWVNGLMGKIADQSGQTVIGSLNDRDFFSTRAAYKLNLRGPAMTVQTACSTSLVAIHMGCQSLLSGESDMVLAGGVSIWLPKKGGYLYEPGMIRSSDGRCRAFDAAAEGTNGGDGAAIVVLKRLQDALADGDRIDAIVRGSAINNDGRRKVGYTAPSVEGQVEVIRSALQMAEVEAESITFVEAHGTATPMGDPIEIEALKRAFATGKRQYCAIGSVKTNVGHLDAAAGAAGFIKTVLALKYRQIPPSLHFRSPNPRIDFENSPFFVNTGLLTPPDNGRPLRAGVSSFGLGGTNAHAVLESPPDPIPRDSAEPQLILISAKTPSALEHMTYNLGRFLAESNDTFNDTAYTLQVGRKDFKHRIAAVAAGAEEAARMLTDPSKQGIQAGLVHTERRPVIFMFSGQGSQYVNMGLDLYHRAPGFTRDMDRCFDILSTIMGEDIKPVLYPGDAPKTDRLHQFTYTTPLKFVFDYCLARLLMNWGIKPFAMTGHSFGEYVAACLAGVFSLEDGLKLAEARGRLMHAMPEGAMMNVPLPEDRLKPYLGDELALAAVNEPSLCIVSGTVRAVEALEQDLGREGLQCMRLKVPRASHSPMVAHMLKSFEKVLREVTFHEPQIPYISGLSGTWITVEEATDPQYWLGHLRHTIRFSNGLETLFEEPDAVFLQVGSGRGLTLFVNRHPAKQPGHYALGLVRHPDEDISDMTFLLGKTGEMWLQGVEIDWAALHRDRQRRRTSLPLYPFDRHYFSVDISSQFQQRETVPEEDLPSPGATVQEQEPSEDIQTFTDPVEAKTAAVLKEILGLRRAPPDHDFFQLGGDSLTAIMTASRLNKTFRVALPVTVILSGSTVKEIAAEIRKLQEQGGHTYEFIPEAEVRDYYPLSSAQKRLFFLDSFEDVGTTYNMPYLLRIKGKLDKERLAQSFDALIRRHETLRTSFHMIHGEPVQVVHGDIGPIGPIGPMGPIFPFDLSRAPLMRAGLSQDGPDEYSLSLDIHHIISDGTSMAVLVNDFLRVYEGGELSPPVVQYKDYALWQEHLYQTPKIKKQEQYWMEIFGKSAGVPVLNLPLDFPRPGVFTYEGDSYGFTLEKEDLRRFQALSARCDATLYMNLLAAFNVLLSLYSGQEDIVVGTAVAGRPHTDVQDLIGMFVNMLAMRNQPRETKTYLQFLEEVKTQTLQAFENQDLQFEDLVDKLTLPRDTSRNPLFSVSLVLQNFQQPDIKIKDAVVTQEEYWNHVSRFDMSVLAYEREEGIYFRIMYYRPIFREETIRRMARHFIAVIRQVAEEPGKRLADIQVLSETGKQKLVDEFNRSETAAGYANEKTIGLLLEEQAARTPDRAAAVFGNRMITYRTLDERVNRLANYLHHEPRLQPDEPVALLLDGSLDMIEAIFAILKAGGAYVPIDPTLPEERMKAMLIDMEARLLISQRKYIRTLHRLQWECPALATFLCLDSHDVFAEEEAIRSKLMDEKLWEYVGETAVDDITGGGWNTSYTGEPFTREEMDEYGDNVLKKLNKLNLLEPGARVLEIGCASGLTMYRVAPEVGFYYGTDLSRVIIEKNREQVNAEGLSNISLAVLAAHQVDRIDEKDFDVIIMNSVIQNFHGHNYFRNVIRKCISLLKETGTLFVGDIMDHDLKNALEEEMKAFKRANRGKGFRTTTDFSDALFLSRNYLEDMAADFPEIVDVECSGKIYTIENELTKFRYDAVVTVDRGGIEKSVPGAKRKHQHDMRTVESFRTRKTADPPAHHPGHLAYMIYTSGSTGLPKGVMVEHRNVAHLVSALQQRVYSQIPGNGGGLPVCMVSPYMFDASVKQIFAVLLLGHTLHIVDEDTRIDGEDLAAYYRRHHIRVSDGTPLHLRLLLESAGIGGVGDAGYFIIGGEALPLELAKDFIHTFDSPSTSIKIINIYGPTECTVDATSFEVSRHSLDRLHGPTVPIGTPLANVQVYITGIGERTGYLQPIGVPGELCIAGAGVSRGYLKRKELTHSKFQDTRTSTIHHLPSTIHQLYRTGDLARWLHDGAIEFQGRIDQQVKIRGFRIELEEIRHRLQAHEDVKEAAVVLKDDPVSGEKCICAYCVPATADAFIDSEDTRDYLSLYLPVYMLPSHVIRLDKMPLTPGGKVNLDALPVPDMLAQRGEKYAAPTDPVEDVLATVWAEVLNIDKAVTGIDDDFFQLGGHSLRALIVFSRIHKVLDVKVPLAQLFKTPTIRELARYIKSSRKDIYEDIKPVEKKEYYPQSFAQRRLFFLEQMGNAGIAYNMPDAYRLQGAIDIRRIEDTFKALIKRHEALRTSFHLIQNEPVQIVHGETPFNIGPIGPIGPIVPEVRPFDLSRAPLFRVKLSQIAGREWMMFFDMHHIVSDGTTFENMVRDFVRLYEGGEAGIEPLAVQYKDYAVWQREPKVSALVQRQEEYWSGIYPEGEDVPVLNLPTDFPRPVFFDFHGCRYVVPLETGFLADLKRLLSRTGATLYMVLMTAFNILLHKYTGQEDIVVGIGTAGRRHADLQPVAGMFVNTLPVRNRPRPEDTARRFLGQVKETGIKAFENQDIRLEELIETINPRRDPSRNPLFDVSLVVQNFQRYQRRMGDVTISHSPVEIKTSRFDITLYANDTGDDLSLTWEYSTTLFKDQTIHRMAAHFITILERLTANIDINIGDIDIISSEERAQLLYSFNDTSIDYPKDKTLHRLFEEQSEKTPYRTAILGTASNRAYRSYWSYNELNRQATHLANTLRRKGAGPGAIIAVKIEHPFDIVTALLAILKSGAAYLPIDPAYPKDRIDYMLKDSCASFLIEGINGNGVLTHHSPHSPIPGTGGLAYIIYTSGTTGKPKGVMIEHRAIVNTLLYRKEAYQMEPATTVLQLFSFAFDGFLTSCFTPLISGAKVVLLTSRQINDMNIISKTLRENHVYHFIAVPSLFQAMLKALSAKDLASLKIVTLAGEQWPPGLVEKALKKNKALEIVNEYGVTEAAVMSTIYRRQEKDPQIKIGRPTGNTQIYILDHRGHVQPIGVPGELCIAGNGLARGYLNNPELTHSKFQTTNSSTIYRYYKTGDLARWLPDGCIEFFGRIDQQVKIRGFRIELGEIENCLLSHETVKETVVTARKNQSGDVYLCAYIVTTDEGRPSVESSELIQHLSLTLPGYMIPSYFIPLDRIPLTPNGKVDRRALPEPGFTAGTDYIPPQNETEQKLAAIWSGVLGLEENRTGIHDNFFELGGHSLKAMVLIANIEKQLNIKIPAAELFKRPTIHQLAEYLSTLKEDKTAAVHPQKTELKEYYPLSFNQERLWIIGQLDPGSTAYHMSGKMVLPPDTDPEHVRLALEQIIRRHDGFRTRFILVNQEPVQHILTPGQEIPLPFEVIDSTAPGEKNIAVELTQIPFDLGQAPLFRSLLVKKERQYELLFCMHHIVSDAWSMEILKKEFLLFYQSYKTGESLTPLPPPIQYKSFSQWQSTRLQDPRLKETSHAYWLNQLESGLPQLDLPSDFSRHTINTDDRKASAGYRLVLPEPVKNRLVQLAHQHQTSLFTVMFSTFNLFLSVLANQSDVVCAIPSAGRDHHVFHDTIGFFLNTLLLKNTVDLKEPFTHLLHRVSQNVLDALHHQNYPLELVRDDLGMKFPDVAVMFNMLNMYDALKEQKPADTDRRHMPGTPEAKFDLNLYVTEYQNGIEIFWNYRTLRFKPATLEYIARQYENLLTQVSLDPQKVMAGFSIFHTGDLEVTGNRVAPTNPYDEFPKQAIYQSTCRRFEETVEKYPHRTAVKTKKGDVTYDRLNRRANRVAHAVLDTGIRQSPVALLMGHDISMIVGLFAVLKSGNSYVPLDPGYPGERLSYMLQDSEARLIVTDKEYHLKALELARQTKRSIPVIDIDSLDREYSTENPGLDIPHEDVAYILYTSGSTGKPKGVPQNHRNLLHFARQYANQLHIHAGDRLSLFSSYSFDAAKMDIYGSLLNGAALYPYDIKEESNLAQLPQWLEDEGITIYHSIPTVYRYFIVMLKPGQQIPSLRFIVLGGEAVYKKDIEAYREFFSDSCLFINGLGPTESTVTLQYFIDKQTQLTREAVAVGFPVGETSVYLLDENNEEARVFGVGEIVYKSDYLALGYLNKPGQTHEMFVTDPVTGQGRVYRTGDLGRRLPDGNIEYAGRKDLQVKVRGYRIEPGEVEAALDRMEGVEKSVVICKQDENNENYLAAYYIPEGPTKLDEPQLARSLSAVLPDYMVPALFFSLDEFPLTATGKIDRNVLSSLDIAPLLTKHQYTAPTDETQKALAGLWRELLHVEQPGVEDNFFVLGGHSLRALQLVSMIHRRFDVKVPLAEVFQNPTIRELSACINHSQKAHHTSIEAVERREYYPQSFAQQRLFFLDQFEDTGTVYNMPAAFKMEGSLDFTRFENAIRALIHRHESLRTSFHLVDNKPVQIVHDNVAFNIGPIGPIGPIEPRPFDLSRAPLFRVEISEISKQEWLVYFDIHHITGDGTSTGILVHDFTSLYERGVEDETLPSLHIQYKDYTLWQHRLAGSGAFQRQEEYWLRIFPEHEELPLLNLATDYPRPNVFRFQGRRYSFHIEAPLCATLKSLCSRTGATLYMILMTSFNILLHKYTGQEDMVVGIGTAGRGHADLQSIAGMFVNTLPLRSRPSASTPCREFLDQVKTDSIDAFENQDIRLETLIDKINPYRDPSRNPLFDVCMVVQNFQRFQEQLPDLTITGHPLENQSSKFDITLYANENENEAGEPPGFILEYCTALFKAGTIQRMAAHFIKVLEQLTANIDVTISDIDILTPKERNQLLYEFSGTAAHHPEDKTIHRLFEEQAGRTPDLVAAVGAANGNNKACLTYRELYGQSTRSSHHLKQKGAGPGSIIALKMKPSIEMIVFLLAILETGAAYLPIDPEYPPERVDYMLHDSAAQLLLTPGNPPLESSGHGVSPKSTGDANAVCYIIYTSGSTGKPKGVVVGHRGFVNLIYSHRHIFDEGPHTRMTQVASPAFDAMALEVWPCLTAGATLCIANQETRIDADRMKQWLIDNSIENTFQSTAMAEFLSAGEWPGSSVALKTLRTGGDRLTTRPGPQCPFKIYNLYGPTEDTVVTTWTEVTPGEDHQNSYPAIGKPIANHQIYILGPNEELQPTGIPGEICIAGHGLAYGYLNRPELTAEKFRLRRPGGSFAPRRGEPITMIEPGYSEIKKVSPLKPFKGTPSMGVPPGPPQNFLLYKTGDLGRWLDDGNIDFIGRIDQQVKIRGYRIELGEIEHCLLNHDDIKEAVVVARDKNGSHYLCAYIVPVNDAPGIAGLKEYLAGKLPAYMIPAFFVPMDTFPISPSGKINRNALPEPKPGKKEPGASETPRNYIEEKLVQAWSHVLGVKNIGITDHFFEMGGDSINAIQVKAMLKKHGLHLKINDLFLHPVISELAACVQQSRPEQNAQQGIVEGDVLPAPIQHWFFRHHKSGLHHFNQAVMLFRERGFDKNLVTHVFTKLVEHHDALRMVFSKKPVKAFNRDTSGSLFDFVYHDFKNQADPEPEIRDMCSRVQAGIDLENGPLVKLGLFHTSGGDHLLIAIHHLVVDGISWRILLEDFAAAYRQPDRGKDIQLQEKTHSFLHWSRALAKYAESKEHREEITYWQNLENEIAKIEPLPRDGRIPAEKKKHRFSQQVTIRLDQEQTHSLLKEVNRAYNTEINDILLTALGMAIKEWSGLNRICIHLEGHGREPVMENIDISRTVGWFTILYPVVLDLKQADDISYAVRHVKETLRRIPNKGFGYGIYKYLNPEAREIPAEIYFNYLGQFGGGAHDDTPFTMSSISAGESKSPELERTSTIDINGMVSAGELSLVFSYNKYGYKSVAIEELANCYRLRLLNIIDFCRKKEGKEMTPSDLGYTGIEIEELDAFEDEFSDLD